MSVAPLLYREHLADLGVDGFARPTRWAPLEETLMTDQPARTPVAIAERSRIEEILYRRIDDAAFALGYALGAARRRLLKNLSLFDVMSALSRGLDAAAARDRAGGEGRRP
jgi:hypothetical protein